MCNVSFVFVTSATDLLVRPLTALSHFLLLSPACSFTVVRAAGLSFFSISMITCSSAVSAGPLHRGHVFIANSAGDDIVKIR